MEKIKTENKEEKIATEEKTSSKKIEKATDFEAMFNKMQEQLDKQAQIIEKQSKVIESLSKEGSNSDNNSSAELISLLKNTFSQTPDVGSVKAIYLEDCGQAMFKLQNGRTVKFRKDGPTQTTYGKVVPLSLEDAILLLNEYTTTFERGALKFDEDHQYLLAEKGIDINSINYNPKDDITKFEELDNEGIKVLYDKLKYFQKDMLRSHIMKILTTNKVKDLDTFVEKVKYLNKLTKKDTFDGKIGAYDMILEKLKEVGLE